MDSAADDCAGRDGSLALLTANSDDGSGLDQEQIGEISSGERANSHASGENDDKGKDYINSSVNEKASDPSKEGLVSDIIPEFVFGKWAVYACAVGNFSLSISLPLALSSMFLDWQEAFQVSRAHTVAVHSTAVGILFGGSIIPGYLMNRFGARITILIGSFLASVGCFASCFATSINFLIVSTGIMGGLGFCFIQLPAIPAITMVITSKYRSIAVSLCTCGAALCNIGFPFVYKFIVHHFTWRGAFVFISGICLHSSVMGMIMTSYINKTSKGGKKTLINMNEETDSNVVQNDLANDPQEPKAEVNNTTESDIEEKCDDICGQFEELPLSPDLCQREKEDTLSHLSALHRFTTLFQRIKNSKWNFVLDIMYILVNVNICTALATLLSFVLIMMDFARTKGFPDESTGLFFLFIVFVTSLVGRLLMGPLNMIPYLHSIIILGIFGTLASIALIALGNATNYTTIVVFLVVIGIGLGASVAIYAKCILDVDSVTMSVYPLALGLSGTLEGSFDFVIPILIGYSVDTTGSYSLIFNLLGGICMATSVSLVITKTFYTYQDYRQKKSKEEDDL